jgi:zona occludens toxin
MAIEAYVGLPGHGKSYGVVEHVVLPSIIEGRHVVTNIPLEREDILADMGVLGSEITQLPEDWFERPDLADLVPAGCVLILDELWRRWPAGLKANNASLADKSLLAEHRHRVDMHGRSMRIVLVTQDLSQLSAWVRILIEQTYKMTKLTAIGSSKKYRVDIYLGAPTGQVIPKSRMIRQTFGQYKKEIYKYYSSATQSATGTVGDESKADKRGVIWRSPLIIFSIVGPIIGIPLGIWYVAGIFTGGFGMVEQSDPVAVQSSAITNPMPVDLTAPAFVDVNPAPALPPVDAYSPVWRVSGFIRRSADKSKGMADWDSLGGYGTVKASSVNRDPMPDLVILHSEIHGLRYLPVTDCVMYPDKINWSCYVDGFKATPWSGRGDSTNWASDTQSLTSRTVSVASGATEGNGTTKPIVNPPPI